MMRGILYS